jgi:hypothetical protein
VLLLLVIGGLTWLLWGAVLRHRAQVISVRGMSTTADVGRLHDMPRVQARDLTMMGPDSAYLTVMTTANPEGANPDPVGTEAEFLIAINEGDPGFAQLHEWIERQSILGIVVPPASRLLRLRCVDDLQPLTLRRLDV